MTVNGVNAKSILHVSDHHPPDEQARIEGTRVIEPLGATITLLLDELRERGMTVSANEATLFLLGIYEDTGTLTYAATTPRDLQAAAWLLAQGANLRIVAEFLRHPLNRDQRALYEKLLAGAETYRFHGHTGVLATGTVARSGEELSALAHKLRDTLEPAALILLMQINGDVQLVARSSTMAIDVGVIAREFGGGGHGRAAAALLVGSRLAEVRARLLQELPLHVQPAAVVADIMSHGVHTLNPETTVEQVYAHMQKHGYEGYPVVEGGQVLGLVTRRAVDRARTHQLEHAPVTDIMEAGAVTVSPDDSVDRLLNEMIGRGWGQVPVSQDGEIVGVVTRTDLIKELALSPERGRRNVADLLHRALSPPHLKLLHTLSAAAQSQGSGLYVVGGFVRDLLLESASVDFDLVVEGEAIKLGRALAKQLGGRVTAHRRFGTAKWHLPAELAAETGLPALDLVSARTEFYAQPSALPEVERGSIKLDLHRRDFTVNTLAVSLQSHRFGDLLDHWGGLKDLDEKRLRVLHSLSFVDDPTRV
ncbi:MAG TPA: CBS domain-containing protein, partial [Anaerolineales bacterium]|nr:CBS domain-containing protein [Anaerolineales bacterium]